MAIPFDNTYARLPERFFARVKPSPVRGPQLVKVNVALAELLGIDASTFEAPRGAAIFGGNEVPDGAEPIALAYAGHQFGSFVQLGDGRAILLGEVVGKDGVRRDIQLKGAGRTPYSRRGDGRAALGPVLREYVVSEAMTAMGIPSTRALAAVATGEVVARDRPLPGAVLARVAKSHLRIGTFELFAARGDVEALVELASYALARHYPDAAGSGNDARALLERVVAVQASLVARWMGVGFIHGVMNTDNVSIAGETLDFGPCAFVDAYDPQKKFSSIDTGGRYAYGNQPRIALWNLTRLAEALLALLAQDEEEAVRIAKGCLERFAPTFEAAYGDVFRAKIGLGAATGDVQDEADRALVDDLLARLAASEVDFTLFFRRLSLAAGDASNEPAVASLFAHPGAFHEWAERWRKRTGIERTSPAERAAAMRRVNPVVIPRNHRVEEVIEAAVSDGDFGPFEALLCVVTRPFEETAGGAPYEDPPTKDERVAETFCGT